MKGTLIERALVILLKDFAYDLKRAILENNSLRIAIF